MSEQHTFTKKELKEIHAQALKRFVQSIGDEAEIRTNYPDNMYFCDGKQWPDDVLAARTGRVSLVINESRKYAENVVNTMRMSTPAIKTTPNGYGASDALAESRNIVFAYIQQISSAKTVFDSTFDCSVKGGIGYFRISSKYLNDTSPNQDIVFERIVDPMSVVFDQSAKELTYSDARYAFYIADMPEETFKIEYPDAAPIDWDKSGQASRSLFFNKKEKMVKVAEYYFKRPQTKELGFFDDGSVYRLDLPSFKNTVEGNLKRLGVMMLSSRKVKSFDVYWCKMNGQEIIDGPNIESSPDIPIIPVLGRETWIDGVRHLSSLITDAKDPNRMLNYHVSNATEQVGMQSSSEYIATAEAVAGHLNEWTSETPLKIKTYNSGTEKPYREPPSQMSQGMAAMIAMTKEQIPDVIGISPDKLGIPTNARSKAAIIERTNSSDIGPYVFTDNLLKSLRYAGEIVNRRIPVYYDTNQILTIKGEDNKVQTTEINAFDPATGGIKNDMSMGEYLVTIETGPSYATLRKESGEYMMQAMQFAPNYQDVILPLVAKAQAWPGAREVEAAIQAKNDAMNVPKPMTTKEKKEEANLQGSQLENIRKTTELKQRGVLLPDQSGQLTEATQGGQ